MKVEKNGKTYSVSEQVKSWVVTCEYGVAKIEYKIDKKLCATLDDLTAYLKNEKLF